jgi:hypothetical protein
MVFRVRLTSDFLPPSSRRDPRHQEDFERIFKIPTPRTFQSVDELTSRDQAKPQAGEGEGEGELAARRDNVRGGKEKTVCAPTTTRELEEN